MRTRIALLTAACTALVFSACDQEAPTAGELTAPEGVAIDASNGNSEVARILQDLRKASAKWHDLEVAIADGYAVNIGCVDERITGLSAADARGMGYHFLDPTLLDDNVEITTPELVVYGRNPENGKLRLAAFDYFIPASAANPGPPAEPPVFPELNIPFTWSPAFGGWMFHIWPWWHNPDGMFDNFNRTLPLCDCALSGSPPGAPTCFGPGMP